MANPETHVHLHVQTGLPPDTAWKKCTDGADNEIDFCFKYTGGDYPANDPVLPIGGPGFFQSKTGQGVKTVHLMLVADSIWIKPNPNSHGFRITTMTCEPHCEQLSMVGGAPAVRQILDQSDIDVEQGTYTIIVAYKPDGGNPNYDIHCDPGWRNN